MYVRCHFLPLRAMKCLPQDIGCAVGSLIVFFCGESIGRKRMIMSGAVTMLIGTVGTGNLVLVVNF